MKKPLLIAALSMLLIGTLVGQTVYWMRVGNEGIRFTETETKEIGADEAKAECATRKQLYTSSREYSVDNVYEVTVKRGFFPSTYREKCLVEGPLFKWSY